jgi:hypothetical protein
MGAWHFHPSPDGKIRVEALDSYDIDDVDLIQLDVEGAEFEALEGARETILRCKPMLCIEIKMTQTFYNRTVEDLYGKLIRLGYETHSAFGRDQLWRPRSR